MTAAEQLSLALADLADRGQATPCHGADEWTSDHAQDRAYAAALCHPCPVLALCLQAADELKATYHVWGGSDRTPPTPTRRKRERHAKHQGV